MALMSDFLARQRTFWPGLALRLALIGLAVPLISASWFTAFIEAFIVAPTLDPWTSYLAAGGDPAAFPYGPMMFFALLPGVALGTLVKHLFGLAQAPVAGYGLSVLAAEMTCLALLTRLNKSGIALACFWLSPAVIIISHWHGQNDLVPVAFTLASLVAVKRYHAAWSGALLGLAIAAKMSMVLAVPVLAIYLFRNTRLRALLLPFMLALAVPLLLQLAVLAASSGARVMILGTPEARKVFQLALDLGGGLKIFLLPVVYALVLLWAWRLRRITFDLLYEVVGIVFLLVFILTPASPGWFIWVMPFLAIHAAQTGSRGLFFVLLFSALQAVATLLQFSGAFIPLGNLELTAPLSIALGLDDPQLISLLISGIFALGLFLAQRMWREGVRRNELYRISRRPLVVAIAGDSGAGKDTLALSIAGLFGEQSVASVPGDDYHRWERKRPIWSAMTHLNPRANDLDRMTGDVLRLAAGQAVSARHYDHRTGRFTKARSIGFNDVIIVSGLHALSIPALRARTDVGVFLDMDEQLRRFFKLRRDADERSHAPEQVIREIERRAPDAERFIRPQRERADVVFSLRPVNEDQIADPSAGGDPRLKLAVVLRASASYEALVRILIGLCSMNVDVDFLHNPELVELTIEGDVGSEDIALAAALLVPNLEELIALDPAWRSGTTGVMQLIVLTQIAHAISTTEIVP